MKTLYLDCSMGASGDMLAGALYSLLSPKEKETFLHHINHIGLDGVTLEAEKSVKCGIVGTHIAVKIDGEEECPHCHGHHHDHDHHHHHHSSLSDIEEIVEELLLPTQIKKDVMAVYTLIADAESEAHGCPVADIHFHEVGTMDAIADISAVCLLMSWLAPQEIVSSPVHVGAGHVTCAHGTLPVPAPATAYLLKDIPMYGGEIQGELCTPTGAALLRHFVTRFGDMPTMKASAIGYGMGKKDFERANCVRAMLGEAQETEDSVYELCCNIDDMTAEAIGFAMERFFEAGALEVYTTPIGMKKSRPGTLISLMCREKDRENMLSLIFKYTTTIGVRENKSRRYVLDRKQELLSTPYGEVRKKISKGYGVTRTKYEYEDLARIAKNENCTLADAIEKIENTNSGEN